MGDPACTLVTCEGNMFLAVINVTDIIIDSHSHLDINQTLLAESTVVIHFQICHLIEKTTPNNSGPEGNGEWRWNRKVESKVMKTQGAFVQALNPDIIVEEIGKPVYSFKTDDLRLLAASLFTSVTSETRPRLVQLKKRTDAFPYQSHSM